MPDDSTFRHVWPLVTRNNVPGQGLSKETRKSLRSVMQAFQEANSYMIRGIQRISPEAAEYYITELTNKLELLEELDHLDAEGDLKNLLEFLQKWHFSEISLIWRAFFFFLLDVQGRDRLDPNWRYAKLLAFDILEKRDVAADMFIPIEADLRAHGLEDVCKAIITMIIKLERFQEIYNTQSGDLEEPVHIFMPIKNRTTVLSLMKMNASSQSMQENLYTPHLVAVVSLTTLLSIVPIGFAWKQSTNDYGTASDPGFYIQIQNSIMTILGICIGLYPTLGRPTSAAKYWAQAFAVLGVICAIAAIPAYLKLPLIWSAVATFAGSAIQVYMALQLVMIAEPGALPIKRD